MPKRNPQLITGQYYHVFNRVNAGQKVFELQSNIDRMLDLVDYCRFPHLSRYSVFIRNTEKIRHDYLDTIMQNSEPNVELYTSEIMPNHFHFVLKQLETNGIRNFISNLQNSFAKYYNDKYKRNGGMFQSPFKAVRIESDEQLKHVIRYNHLNPVTSGIVEIEALADYPASTFQFYLDNHRSPVRLFNPKFSNSKFINVGLILSIFKSSLEYKKFVFDQADYQRSLHNIKELI